MNEELEKWLDETKDELSRLKFEADIYDNELEELYHKGYTSDAAARKYYNDWNHI